MNQKDSLLAFCEAVQYGCMEVGPDGNKCIKPDSQLVLRDMNFGKFIHTTSNLHVGHILNIRLEWLQPESILWWDGREGCNIFCTWQGTPYVSNIASGGEKRRWVKVRNESLNISYIQGPPSQSCLTHTFQGSRNLEGQKFKLIKLVKLILLVANPAATARCPWEGTHVWLFLSPLNMRLIYFLYCSIPRWWGSGDASFIAFASFITIATFITRVVTLPSS